MAGTAAVLIGYGPPFTVPQSERPTASPALRSAVRKPALGPKPHRRPWTSADGDWVPSRGCSMKVPTPGPGRGRAGDWHRGGTAPCARMGPRRAEAVRPEPRLARAHRRAQWTVDGSMVGPTRSGRLARARPVGCALRDAPRQFRRSGADVQLLAGYVVPRPSGPQQTLS